ncbi:MAG: PilZ domain-containing protein [Candidatus Rokubacteria bacterium]|nr:PilZ domain-containing protein [Candidatus Rokubacteria bacterium]
MGRDRRRYPRVGVALDITIEAGDDHWRGKTVDLSPHGVKVALPPHSVKLSRGTNIRLGLPLPDGAPPLSLTTTVVRTDRDGIGLNFVDHDDHQFQRLKAVVDSFLEQLSGGPPRPDVDAQPVKERRRSPRVDAELDISFDAEKPYDWRGKTINLSPHGVKVALPASAIRPSEGTTLQLRLVAPDNKHPILIKGMVWRREPKSTVLVFVELGREQLERLKALVDFLGAQRV